MPEFTTARFQYMKLLLVDGDNLAANQIVSALEPEGHQVTWLTERSQAGWLLERSHFDLVILDIGYPNMEGLEILLWLRERNDNTLVMLMSTRMDLADRLIGFNSGADAYIEKPFEVGELMARLRAVLRRIFASESTR